MAKSTLDDSLEQLIWQNNELLKQNNRLLVSIDEKLRKMVINTSSPC
ncbi:MAG: hypothetical protein ABI361_09200 [Nitrososphaera sp.]